MISIGLCMIVKNEEAVLRRILTPMSKLVDKIYICDTGSVDKTKEIAREFTDEVYDFLWNDDFSAARNFITEKADTDYWMWLDADDVITPENQEKLLRLKESMDSDTDVVMMDYAVGFDEWDHVTFSYYRERIMKTFRNFRWQGRVHETVVPAGNILYSDVVIEHRKIKAGESFRNLHIYEQMIDSGEKMEPRHFFYYGRELFYHKQYEYAILILKKLEKYDGKQNISQGLRAAMNGDDHKLQKLVISDKINKKDKGQVLAFAAAHCNVDTLKIMKKQGYDFAWKDSDKVGLLQIAALCNHSSVVKYLLEQQLDSKAKADYYKVRAVDFAIVAGNLDNAKILIEKDKVNFKKNHHGKPCDVWEFILAFGDKKSFKTLESLGHQPTKEDELQEIIWNGESDIARKILENKMTKGKVRKEYLLQTAVDIGDYTMVRYLVEQGADINKYVKEETENYSSTALQTACASQSQEILKYLKKHGGDSKKKDSEGRSCKKIAKDNKAVWNLELIQ